MSLLARTWLFPIALAGCTSGGTEDDSGSKVDEDWDGYGLESDCNDTDPLIHPGAAEVCDAVGAVIAPVLRQARRGLVPDGRGGRRRDRLVAGEGLRGSEVCAVVPRVRRWDGGGRWGSGRFSPLGGLAARAGPGIAPVTRPGSGVVP